MPATRSSHLQLLVTSLALAAFVGTGCGPGAGLPKEVTTQEVESGVTELFKTAKPEARKLAEEIAEAIKKQDFTSAWDKLHTLAEQPGLTDPQKSFVASSTASVGAEVNKAEATGNEAAKQALEFHRANK
jgi:hypothetical protein